MKWRDNMALSNEIDLSVEQLPQNPIILTPADESDYNNLANKPKINDIVLEGDKTYSDLGLASAEQGAKADSAVQPADLSVYRTSADQDIIDATKATKEELDGYLPLTSKAVANGVASLDENAKVPENQLPDVATYQAILREW